MYILIDDNVSFFQKTRKQESNHNVNEDDTAEKREDRYLLRARANKERERKRDRDKIISSTRCRLRRPLLDNP